MYINNLISLFKKIVSLCVIVSTILLKVFDKHNTTFSNIQDVEISAKLDFEFLILGLIIDHFNLEKLWLSILHPNNGNFITDPRQINTRHDKL